MSIDTELNFKKKFKQLHTYFVNNNYNAVNKYFDSRESVYSNTAQPRQFGHMFGYKIGFIFEIFANETHP